MSRAVGVQHVVVEAVLLVPQALARCIAGDQREVLEELRREVLVGAIVLGQRSARCSSRFRQYMAIQAVPSDCSSTPCDGERRERSNGPMLSRPRNPPSKTLLPAASLRLTHQVKLSSSLWKTRSRNVVVGAAVDLEHPQRRPGVHRRVDVAERPLVGGELPVGVHVPLAAQQDELCLGERRVDVRERDAVEGQVPRRVPRVLPRVGHRDHVVVVEMRPVVVAARAARLRRRRGWPGSPSSQRCTS